MCRTRKDTLVSHPQPPATLTRPLSTPTRRHSTPTATNSSNFVRDPTSFTSTTSSSSSSSTKSTSLTTLRLSLSDSPILYPFSEISASTNHFLSTNRISSSSWRCTLRDKEVVVLQVPFRGDPVRLPSRLSAACKSHHSSLVELVSASFAGGDYIYLVYDYVSGATLRECLRNPRNPDFTALSTWISRMQIATDLADGLEYIHFHCRTTHNRIKSSSVIVTEPNYNAKICHFGVADLAGDIPEEIEKIAEDHKEGDEFEEEGEERGEIAPAILRRSNSRGMKIDGTRGYIAPEVLGGGRISQKSDVFAFGVVILELISGKEPLKYTMNRETGEYERVSLIETAREAIGTEDEDGASEAEAEERKGRVRRWVDRRLRDSFPVEAAEKMIRVALRCVEEEAFMRPEMRKVAGTVSKLFLDSKVWDERVRLPTDFSVTIGPR